MKSKHDNPDAGPLTRVSPRRGGVEPTLPPMPKSAAPAPNRQRANDLPAIAVVVSRYNSQVTIALLEGAIRAYVERGGDPSAVHVFDAPGAYELPALSLAAAETHRYAGVVAIGCLVRGETRHDRYIAEAVSQGLVNITIATGVPVAFGLLTVDTPAQAKARAGGKKGNKGADAMHAALDTIASMERIMLGQSVTGTSIERALPDKTAKPEKQKAGKGKDKKSGKGGGR